MVLSDVDLRLLDSLLSGVLSFIDDGRIKASDDFVMEVRDLLIRIKEDLDLPF